MALDKFRRIDIRLDRANDHIMSNQFAKAGEYNGRDLFVQVTNGGIATDTTGVQLVFGWFHEQKRTTGLAYFEEVDLSEGVYMINYPTEMLHAGTVVAVIQIVEGKKITPTRNFRITVEKSPIDENTVEADNNFSLLQDALIQINQYQNEIDVIKQDLINQSESLLTQKENELNQLYNAEKAELDALQDDYQQRAQVLEATYSPRLFEAELELTTRATKAELQQVSLAFKESFDTLADLQAAYPNGDIYNHCVLDDGTIYTWANNTWTNTHILGNGTGAAELLQVFTDDDEEWRSIE